MHWLTQGLPTSFHRSPIIHSPIGSEVVSQSGNKPKKIFTQQIDNVLSHSLHYCVLCCNKHFSISWPPRRADVIFSVLVSHVVAVAISATVYWSHWIKCRVVLRPVLSRCSVLISSQFALLCHLDGVYGPAYGYVPIKALVSDCYD